jgi:VCBS repeat-containing protein
VSQHARTGPPVRTIVTRLGLLAGILLALFIALGGQPFRLGGARPIATTGGQGYWLLAKDGGVFAYGDAAHHGNNLNTGNDIIGLAPTPTNKGYWTADDDGTVFAYGDAVNHGSRVSEANNIRAFAARPQGDGYWLVTADGVVTARGGAGHHGNTPALASGHKVVGMVSTPSGNGYWLVGRDGGIFAFGDAGFYGSTGAMTLNQPIMGIARHPSGNGYWFVAADGGVFAFGGAGFFGSTGANPPASGVVGISATPSGNGYWLVAGNGKVFPFGDAANYGDASTLALAQPVIGVIATPVVHSNQVPAAVADSASVAEDGSTSVSVLANDAGLGDGSISVSIVSGPAHGTASVSDNKINYSPAANYNGPDSITYKVTDADNESSTGVLSFNVTAVNDAPSVSGDTLSTDEDAAAGDTLSGSDLDGNSLIFSVVAQPAHGSVVISGSNYTYTPAADYNGPDSFTFRANDGSANSNTATVSVTVNPVNDAPVVEGATIPTDEDTPLNGAPVGTDVDGDELDFTILTEPTLGEISSNLDGTYTYTPDANVSGTDSFTYKANDGTVDSNIATVTIEISPVDDPAVASDGAMATDEDVPADGVLASTDAIDDNNPNFVIVSGPSHGSISDLNGETGDFTYTPAANYNGSDSFSFAADGDAANETPATVTISVASVEDAPVFVESDEGEGEDEGGFLDISATGTDLGNHGDDGDTTFALPFPVDYYGETYSGNVRVSPNGWISFDESAHGYTNHALPVASPVIFPWWDDLRTDNGAGHGIYTQVSGSAPNRQLVVQWNVTRHSEYVGTAVFQVVLTEGSPVVSIRYDDVHFPTGSDAGAGATVGVNKDGTTFRQFSYDSADLYDGLVLNFDTSINGQTVGSANDLTTDEDTPLEVEFPATDGDNDALTYAIVDALAHPELVIDSATGAVTFTPVQDYSGSYSFTVSVTDGHSGPVTKDVTVTVLPVNDPPTFNASPDNSETILEEGTAGGDLDAGDVEGDDLTFSIAEGDEPANGTASVVAGSGVWSYTGALNFAGVDTFDVTVTDENGGSSVITVTVTVTNVNDAPTVSTIGGQSTGEDTLLEIPFTVGDPDTGDELEIIVASSDPSIAGILAVTGDGAERTLTITPALNANGSALIFVAVSDGEIPVLQEFLLTVTPVNDLPVANAGTLTTDEDVQGSGTLTGSDPVEGSAPAFALDGDNGGAAHGTVTLEADGDYTYVPEANYNGPDSFSFVVNDGEDDSLPATVSITVTAVNDIPVADGGSLTTAEDTQGSGTVTGSDPVEESPVAFALVGPDGGAAHGTVSLEVDGDYTYVPDPDYNGSDSFTFVANDGGDDDSLPATVSITVTAVNDAPVVSAIGSQSVDEDEILEINFSASDVDGDVLTIHKGSSNLSLIPSGGLTLGNVGDDWTLTVDSALNQFGNAEIFLSVSDGKAPSILRLIPVTVNSVNDNPIIAEGDAPVDLAVAEDDSEGESVSFNATDVENAAGALLWSSSDPVHGTVTAGAPGTFTYVPDANFEGSESFTLTVTDANSGTDTIQVNVTIITLNNDAPVADNATEAVGEDTVLNSSVSATDVDAGDTRTYSVVAGPSHGDLALNPDGTYSYDSDPDYNGPDSFTFKATDAALADSNVATVSITVDPVNDPPAADDAAPSVGEDTVLNGTVTGDDIDGDDLTYAKVTDPTHGVLVLNPEGIYTYTADGDFNGSDSFTFRANDGTADSDVATVSITVDAANDAPVANEATPSVDEDTVLNSSVSATDVDAGDTRTYSVVAGPSHGDLALNPDGTYSYDSDSHYYGPDSFTFKATDAALADSNVATVSITVDPVNDAPVALDSTPSVDEDDVLEASVSATDVDDPGSFYELVVSPTHGDLSFGSNGGYTYTPLPDFSGVDTFTFKASDTETESNVATVTITVTSDGITAGDDNDVTLVDVILNDIDVLANDVVSDGLAAENAVAIISSSNGLAEVNGANKVTFTPANGFDGEATFVYTVTDADGDIETATVTITISVAPIIEP